MVEPAPRGPQRIQRRDAMRMLAASTGAVAGGSLIVSSPAHADVGSEPCLFTFTGNPVVTVTAFNTSFIGDFITLSFGPIGGSCGCGATASFQYAFHLKTPLTTAGSGTWGPSDSASLSFANLWGAAGGPFTVLAGVRVTCAGPSGTSIRCRFASATFNMGASFASFGDTFMLSTNNGNSAFPNLPLCDAAPLRVAALQSDVAMMYPGVAPIPVELQALIDGAPEQPPIVVLAEPARPEPAEGEAVESSSDEAATTPTPAPTTSSTTATPTTTTTTTTTTAPPSTSPSTPTTSGPSPVD